MNDPEHSEDPIWSRWRERHGRRSGPPSEAPAPEPAGNGGGDQEPRRAGAERIGLGDPLPPGWADRGAATRPPPGPPPGEPEPPPRRGPDPADSPPPPAREPAETHESGRECLEWCPICRSAELVRSSLPPELRTQFEGVQRDALVAMRALLDHYIERLDGGSREGSPVEDIPID